MMHSDTSIQESYMAHVEHAVHFEHTATSLIYSLKRKGCIVDDFLSMIVPEVVIIIHRAAVWNCRDRSGYGLSQWGTTLHCNVVSHWLSVYPEWSLSQWHNKDNLTHSFAYSLNTKSWQDDNFLITGGTGACLSTFYDNICWRWKWRQLWHHDNSPVSVF